MKRNRFAVSWRRQLALLAIGTLLAACGGGDENSDPPPPPPKATLEVQVVDATSTNPVANARVVVQNGDTGAPVDVLTTGADGVASLELSAAAVPQALLRVSAQGYISSPPEPGTAPVPHALSSGETTTVTIELDALPDAANLGAISGTVFEDDGTSAVDNALVVALGATASHSVATAGDGTYVLFNVPAETVAVTAWKAGYNFPEVAGVVVAATETETGVDVVATSTAGGSIAGQISFLASPNAVVDITLLHPETGDVIPGLRTYNDGNNVFSLTSVPDGEFHATASFETDGYVLDPDSVVKHGVPTVTITTGSAETLDFDVTGAVVMRVPTDGDVIPINNPTFEWEPYSSTSDYVVEVSDTSGNVIWGGFNPDKTKRFTVMAADTQTDPATSETYYAATYDSDSNATEPLTQGEKYRVRVYASKDVNVIQDPLEYKLISASEGLVGVFTVGPPE